LVNLPGTYDAQPWRANSTAKSGQESWQKLHRVTAAIRRDFRVTANGA